MKRFKKKGFWVFYVAVILAGAFIIVALGLQNQSPVIPSASAQYGGFGGFGGFNPQGSLFDYQTSGYHPSDIIFPVPTKPGDDGSDGESKMRTIMTCSGCSQTISTCDWQCGVTFTQCGGPRGGQGSTPESGKWGRFLTYLSELCTQGLIRAMKEEGLNDQQIQLICKKAELYQKLDTEKAEDPYSKAIKLFDQGKYDDVISELSPYCNENPDVIRPKILLAKAYLEKCDVMKANGDNAYQELIYTPYTIWEKRCRRSIKMSQRYCIY